MLTIRNEQMAALSAYKMRGFETRMVQHIATAFPIQYEGLGEGGTEALIRRSMEIASEFGIKAERETAAFIELMVAFGDGFESVLYEDWVLDILEDPTLAGEAKIQLIRLGMLEE